MKTTRFRCRVAAPAIAALVVLFPFGALAKEVPPSEGGGVSSDEVQPVDPEHALGIGEIKWISGGNEVDSVPAGRETTLRLGLMNFGSETFPSVTVRLGQAQGIQILVGDAVYGDLAGEQMAVRDFTILVEEIECQESYSVPVEVVSGADTFNLAVEFRAACPGPRLYIQNFEFRGGDGDGIPEPGETLDLYVTLANDGRDPSDVVTGTLDLRGEGVELSSPGISWPPITPGGQEIGSPVTVRISGDAPTQPGCEGPLPLPIEIEGAPPGAEPVEVPPPAEEPAISDPGPGSTEPSDSDAPVTSGQDRDGGIEPEPSDPGVAVEGTIAVSAGAYKTTLEFSNAIACAFAESIPVALGARDDASPGSSAGVLPIVLGVVSLGSAVALALLLGRKKESGIDQGDGAEPV